jgi:hypothetical protein
MGLNPESISSILKTFGSTEEDSLSEEGRKALWEDLAKRFDVDPKEVAILDPWTKKEGRRDEIAAWFGVTPKYMKDTVQNGVEKIARFVRESNQDLAHRMSSLFEEQIQSVELSNSDPIEGKIRLAGSERELTFRGIARSKMGEVSRLLTPDLFLVLDGTQGAVEKDEFDDFRGACADSNIATAELGLDGTIWAANVEIIKGRVRPSSAGRRERKNLIFFGPPGTGKSHEVALLCKSGSSFRTQFHPEYSYSDFVGSYRPVVGHEVQAPYPNRVISVDGSKIARPVNYFSFVPGPFARALVAALIDSAQQVFFVIEEINRGDCAAIFGDIFQLLDRDGDGKSVYSVLPRPELANYLTEQLGNTSWHFGGSNGEMYLPGNLSILATMNTSDRSLFPMDAAFKRRWDWQFVGVEQGNPRTVAVTDKANSAWNYVSLIKSVNKAILELVGEDKMIGPWFIAPNSKDEVDFDAVVSRLFFYLWHDVFRDARQDPRSPFKPDIKTFGELQKRARERGLADVFSFGLERVVASQPDGASLSLGTGAREGGPDDVQQPPAAFPVPLDTPERKQGPALATPTQS